MSDSPQRMAAYLRAYGLFEEVQGEEHAEAAVALPDLERHAQSHGWDDVAFVAAAGRTLYGIVRPPGEIPADEQVEALLERAQELQRPAFVALALGLRSLTAAARGDAAALLADTGRAVALLDDDRLPPLDRCTAYVVAAGAYNTLSLWEIVDELYDRAGALVPQCPPGPGQEPALAVNRILIRLEWATALLELGEEQQARTQLEHALAAVPPARDVALPDLWRLDVEGCDTALRLLLGEPLDPLLPVAARQSRELRTSGDIEVLPLLDACRALALVRAGRDAEAAAVAAELAEPTSASSGARSFPAWVHAVVAAGSRPSAASRAYADYAHLVARNWWQSRESVLVAARSFLAMEGLRVEHDRLSRDVLVDPLTGLHNRRAFDEWLQRPGTPASAALLLLDLDGFKKVNDTYGHAAGDEVLRRVGRIVAEHIRPGDLALRHGGDEFAVVIEHTSADASVVRRRAEELRKALRVAPWEEVGPGLVVGTSIGVAVGSLRDGAARLYERADDALYTAKTDPTGVVLISGT